jgi:hypothetical protein
MTKTHADLWPCPYCKESSENKEAEFLEKLKDRLVIAKNQAKIDIKKYPKNSPSYITLETISEILKPIINNIEQFQAEQKQDIK